MAKDEQRSAQKSIMRVEFDKFYKKVCNTLEFKEWEKNYSGMGWLQGTHDTELGTTCEE